jgi:hypothetical protein
MRAFHAFFALLAPIALAGACSVDPTADGPTSCEPSTALDCTGDNNCKGGQLCIGGMGYGSCECLDDAGALVLPDGGTVFPHPPVSGADAGGATGADAHSKLPILDAASTKKDASTPKGTTCDNAEMVAPAP